MSVQEPEALAEPEHAGQASEVAPEGSVTCPRCGSFVASLLEPPIGVCRPCGEKLLPPPLRGPLTIGGIAHGSGLVLRTAGLSCALLALAFSLPGDFFFALVPEAPIQLQTLYGLVTLIADLGIMVLAQEAVHGRSLSIGDALGRGLPRYGAVFGARFRAGIQLFLWSLLLILPGIYKAAQYSLAGPVALFEPAAAPSAVNHSIARTRGLVLLLLAVQTPIFALAVGGPVLVWVLLAAEVEATGRDVSETAYITISVALGILSTLVLTLLTIVQQVVYAKTALDAQLAPDRA